MKPKKKMLVELQHVISVLENDRYRADHEGKGQCYLATEEEEKELRKLHRILLQMVGPFATGACDAES